MNTWKAANFRATMLNNSQMYRELLCSLYLKFLRNFLKTHIYFGSCEKLCVPKSNDGQANNLLDNSRMLALWNSATEFSSWTYYWCVCVCICIYCCNDNDNLWQSAEYIFICISCNFIGVDKRENVFSVVYILHALAWHKQWWMRARARFFYILWYFTRHFSGAICYIHSNMTDIISHTSNIVRFDTGLNTLQLNFTDNFSVLHGWWITCNDNLNIYWFYLNPSSSSIYSRIYPNIVCTYCFCCAQSSTTEYVQLKRYCLLAAVKANLPKMHSPKSDFNSKYKLVVRFRILNRPIEAKLYRTMGEFSQMTYEYTLSAYLFVTYYSSSSPFFDADVNVPIYSHHPYVSTNSYCSNCWPTDLQSVHCKRTSVWCCFGNLLLNYLWLLPVIHNKQNKITSHITDKHTHTETQGKNHKKSKKTVLLDFTVGLGPPIIIAQYFYVFFRVNLIYLKFEYQIIHGKTWLNYKVIWNDKEEEEEETTTANITTTTKIYYNS